MKRGSRLWLGRLICYLHKNIGQVINLFLFYPQYGGSGKIGSIALYGANLQGHYNAMRSSMTAFGMPISDIQFDSGIETFLDITLDY